MLKLVSLYVSVNGKSDKIVIGSPPFKNISDHNNGVHTLLLNEALEGTVHGRRKKDESSFIIVLNGCCSALGHGQ